jgi:hypothetical protein
MVGARTPRASHIPQWSISEVEPVASALAELAAPASNARVAQQMGGVSPAGGKFRSKLGTAGYYGLAERKQDLLVLTPRGEAIVGDDEAAAREARREAVMGTAFGEIIRRFAGREPSEATIRARLEDDYQVPVGSSEYVAGVLIRAAREADLISNGRFDAAAIESVPITQPSPSGNGKAPKPWVERKPKAEPEVKTGPGEEKEKERVGEAKDKEKERTTVEPPFPPSVRVVVNVDASSWTPNQVAEFVRALREPTEPDAREGTETS